MSTPDDQELLARIAAKDRRAFELLFQRYYPRLFRYLFRVTRRPEMVEELIGEVLFVVWQTAGRFEGRSRPSSWIFGIAYRKALKALSRDPSVRVPPDHGSAPAHPVEGPEVLMVRREMSSQIGRALATLSVEQRAVVELTFFEGLAYREIAELVGCPVNTVKTRMFHAKRRLRELLPELGRAGTGGRREAEP